MEDFTEDQRNVIVSLFEEFKSTSWEMNDFLEQKGLKGAIFVPGWYKSSQSDKYLMYWPNVFGPSYGLSMTGQWFGFDIIEGGQDMFSGLCHLSLAGYDFVRDTLIEEAKRRGYDVDIDDISFGSNHGDHIWTVRGNLELKYSGGRLFLWSDEAETAGDGYHERIRSFNVIFQEGRWFDTVSEKIEKKSSENELPDVFDSFDNLITSVQRWSIEKGIDKAAPEKQFLKVIEETGEIASALAKSKPKEELMDALGDTFVTLIILSQQLNLDPKECLQMAYDIISKRTGKTVDGVFVKSEDLVK